MAVSWSHLCRLCAANSDLSEDLISSSNLSQIILKYLSISIKNDDDLSVRICRTCEEKVTDFHSFASECERIQSMFEAYKNESIFSELNLRLVKTENNEEVEVKQEFNCDSNDDGIDDRSEIIVPIKRKRRKATFGVRKKVKRQKIKTENITNGIEIKDESENETKTVVIQMPVAKRKNKTKKIDYSVINFDCHLCELKYENWEDLQLHVNKEHGTKPNIQCTCAKILNNKPSLQRHLRKHNPERCLMCDTCKKTFGSRKEIITHVLTHMPKIRKYVCCKCAKKFATPKMLRKHETIHLPMEERLIWKCETCNNRFVSKTGLVQHNKIVHLKLRPHMCHLCGRSFSYKADLKEHSFSHSSQRNFKCEKCDKGFKTKQALYRHKDSHPDTAYQCPHCPMLLNTRSTLRNHLAVHDDGPSHYCSVCKKGFKRKKDLQSHMKQHTGERPFSCPWCQRTFTSDSNCRMHKRRMHPSEFELAELEKPPTFYAERKKNLPRKIIHAKLVKQPKTNKSDNIDEKELEETANSLSSIC